MNGNMRKLTAWASAFVLVLGFSATASAQVSTCRIDVTVEDATGGRLPGVSVDIMGPASQSQVTDARGRHFLNLPVGVYSLKSNISGFNPTRTQASRWPPRRPHRWRSGYRSPERLKP
jgi:hypothetical protein